MPHHSNCRYWKNYQGKIKAGLIGYRCCDCNKMTYKTWKGTTTGYDQICSITDKLIGTTALDDNRILASNKWCLEFEYK
uniref:Uncharacterized protein n=1 Tax=viral metagenome TaxID=1070528 RepID=A0A6H1ZD38_9ZZZZ